MAEQTYDIRIEEYLAQVQAKSDKIIDKFILLFFLIGVALAPIYSTWVFSLGVGTLNVGLYLAAKFLISNRYYSRLLISVVFSVFMLQFIGQMHGMAEMHFVFFINSAILIIYQDWRIMVPYTFLAILHHSFFFFLQLTGMHDVGIYFINYTEVDLEVLFFHYGWAILMAVVSGWWSIILRNNNIKMLQSSLLIEQQNKQLMQSEEEIRQNLDELKAVQDTLADRNKRVEKLLEDVTSSMNYASRIQQAILPEPQVLEKIFPESFVYYQPKDIVSGDFYWFYPKRQKLLLAVADCTGHGIPGALMSMIGIETLNKLAYLLSDQSPNLILSELQRNIRHSLKQHQTDDRDTLRDGMDIGLCVFDLEKGKLYYAGAMQNMLISRGAEQHLLKGDRQSIGGRQKQDEPVFTLHEWDMTSGDMIYLYSDGYKDQFGGPAQAKLGTKGFHELLGGLSALPAGTQRQALADFQKNWLKGKKQIDDIVVLGLRIP